MRSIACPLTERAAIESAAPFFYQPDDAYAAMVRLQDTDASAWKCSGLQTNLYDHALTDFVDADMRAKLNVGRLRKGGSAYTPNQSTYRASDFRGTNGPSFRVVVDVGNWDNSRAVNMPGESGDPDSPHYRDLAQMWLDGQYFPLLYARRAVEAATEKRVHLVSDTH